MRVSFLAVLGVLAVVVSCQPVALDRLSFSLAFEPNGATAGSAPAAPRHYAQGTVVTVPGNLGKWAKTGSAFAGWTTDPKSATPSHIPGATFTLVADTRLHAFWILNTYEVTFDSRGGSPVAGNQARHGSTVTVPSDPVLAGHAFGGWYREPECVTAWVFDNDTVSSALTLYAKWVKNAFSVTFDSQGGPTEPGTAVFYGGLVPDPGHPVWAGHVFGGWYREPECVTAWVFGTDTVTSALTLYAQWTLQSYAVAFDSRGGGTVPGTSAAHGTKLTAPAVPAWTGHVFGGWYREPECVTAWVFGTDTVTSALTLYAQWTVQYSETAPDTVFALRSAAVSVGGTVQTHYYHLKAPASYNADKTKSFPLVIYLHGSGASNNPADLKEDVPYTWDSIRAVTSRATDPAFLYVPVCPPPYTGQDGAPTAPEGGEWNSPAAQAMVVATVRDLQSRFNIDPARIYLMGFSMGGAGCWYIADAWYQAEKRPFAAVVRSAGWYLIPQEEGGVAGYPSLQASLSRSPVWLHVGQDDSDSQLKYNSRAIAVRNYADFKAAYPGTEDPVTTRVLADPDMASGQTVADYSRQVLSTGAEIRLSVYRARWHEPQLLVLDPEVIPWMLTQRSR